MCAPNLIITTLPAPTLPVFSECKRFLTKHDQIFKCRFRTGANTSKEKKKTTPFLQRESEVLQLLCNPCSAACGKKAGSAWQRLLQLFPPEQTHPRGISAGPACCSFFLQLTKQAKRCTAVRLPAPQNWLLVDIFSPLTFRLCRTSAKIGADKGLLHNGLVMMATCLCIKTGGF